MAETAKRMLAAELYVADLFCATLCMSYIGEVGKHSMHLAKIRTSRTTRIGPINAHHREEYARLLAIGSHTY